MSRHTISSGKLSLDILLSRAGCESPAKQMPAAPTPPPAPFCLPLLKPALEGWLQNGSAKRTTTRNDVSFQASVIKMKLLISGGGETGSERMPEQSPLSSSEAFQDLGFLLRSELGEAGRHIPPNGLAVRRNGMSFRRRIAGRGGAGGRRQHRRGSSAAGRQVRPRQADAMRTDSFRGVAPLGPATTTATTRQQQPSLNDDDGTDLRRPSRYSLRDDWSASIHSSTALSFSQSGQSAW